MCYDGQKAVEWMRILMIEDDGAILEAVEEAVSEHYILEGARTLQEAKNKIKTNLYQMILLDIQLPDGNGVDFIQEIRRVTNIPVIFLSVVSDENIIARGLDLGADDYIIKPFSVQVLLSRINSVLRRYEGLQRETLSFGDITVHLSTQQVFKKQQPLALTPVETSLFFSLVNARGKILTRRYLLESIWDDKGQFVEDNTLTVHIRRLKQKIGENYIHTKRNVGYYFSGDAYEKR